ncbi:hypothetical protein C5167_043680 [Papaver somniferum]|uniref:Uncharacterized protein n=1 Tax=Papaver somniferum TaxID=3469 RepID=A0A4Y7L8U8_PAPSO|nr:hypothetical protein C5167_043680 [Papaver somniferum]
MNPQTTEIAVRQISKCIIKPHQVLEESKQPHYLTPYYIQDDLLFQKPAPSVEDPYPTGTLIDQLKHSPSITLTHFYPLSGRMVTKQQDNPPFYGIYVDCSDDSVGVEFIHAAADINMMDILTPVDVPRIIQAFFALEGANCHDGDAQSLCDGTSFWKFFNALADITRKVRKASKEAEFIERYERPLLRERMFHFTEESLAKLKAKANEECNTKHTQISSFQASSALVWRSITRARHFTSNKKTGCRLAIDNRLRLNPPVSENYFGNCVQSVCGTTTAGELLEHGIGWAALLLHKAVKEHTNEKIRGSRDEWMRKPYILKMGTLLDDASVLMGNSPRFDIYGCDFGLGVAVAARCGLANKFDGKVTSYRGLTGIQSVMLEVQNFWMLYLLMKFILYILPVFN